MVAAVEQGSPPGRPPQVQSYNGDSNPPCGTPGCDGADNEVVDLLCRAHGVLLMMTGASKWARFAAGGGLCAAVWGGFFLTALLHSSIPVYLVLVVVGWGVGYLPLRAFRVARRSVTIGWLVACLAVPLWGYASAAFTAFVVFFTTAVWAVRLGFRAFVVNADADSEGGSPGAALAATIAGVATAAFALNLVFQVGPLSDEIDLPASGDRLLARAGVWSLLLALATMAAFAAVACTSGWRTAGTRPLRQPHSPRPLPHSMLPSSSKVSVQAQPARARGTQPARAGAFSPVGLFVDVVLSLVATIADAMVRVLYQLLLLAVSIANWLLLWAVQLRVSFLETIELFARSCWQAFRTIVVPTASLLGAAFTLSAFASADLRYARFGHLGDMWLQVGWALAGYGLLTVAWLALCVIPLKRAWPGAFAAATAAAASAIVILMAGGWILGIAGFFGYGPIHVGPATLGATVLVVAVMVVTLLRRDRSGSQPPPAPATSLSDPRSPVLDPAGSLSRDLT